MLWISQPFHLFSQHFLQHFRLLFCSFVVLIYHKFYVFLQTQEPQTMINPLRIFNIRKEERWPALAVFIYLSALNGLAIYQHFEEFTRCGRIGYYSLFMKYFNLSGYDPFTYITLSEWRSLYSIERHPLLAVFVYPLTQLNHWLMGLTGMNCAIFIWATVLIILALYSTLFLFRILREIVGISYRDSLLLSAFFLTFGHIMVTVVAPDHFALSLFFLLLTLYAAGKAILENRPLSTWKTASLLFLSTGVTTTNCVKIGLAQWFANGKRFFCPKLFLISMVMPMLLIGCGYAFINEYIQKPEQERREHTLAERLKKDVSFRKTIAETNEKTAHLHANAIMEGENFRWTDLHLSRPHSIIENLFGESLMLHEDHMLQDVNKDRPIFVAYHNKLCYVIAVVMMLLLVGGIVTGIRWRFMQLCLSWFCFDMLLHLVLGFGLIEVYIMTAHWAFILPIAAAFLLKRLQRPAVQQVLRLTLVFCTVFMLAHNGLLFLRFMLH